MAYLNLMQQLRAGGIVLLDGATGTELQRLGAKMDDAAWCAPATLSHEALLRSIHADYIRAGSQVITANTFAASPLMLRDSTMAGRSRDVVASALAAARAARDNAGVADVVVAGSLSHMVPMTPGSAVLDRSRMASQAEISDSLHAVAQALKDNGCELILLEMMHAPDRAALALQAALATGLPVWFGLSARRGASGRPVSFHAFDELPIASLAQLIPAQGIDVAGVMHSGAEIMQGALDELRAVFKGPLMAYPDSGYFEMPDWRFFDIITPERFEQFCLSWLRAGVQVIGGCCGLGVAHIDAARRARDIVLAERGR